MKNAFGMPLVVCIEDFKEEVVYYNYRRIQEYKKGTTYSWRKHTEILNKNPEDKISLYDEKGMKGCSTITKELFAKYFIDLDKSILEVNILFEEIMDLK